MITRIPVTVEHIQVALNIMTSAISRKIEKHGTGAYISVHEGLGFLTEEYHELVDAARRTHEEFTSECLDVAVVCLWTIASMVAGSEADVASKAAIANGTEVSPDA